MNLPSKFPPGLLLGIGIGLAMTGILSAVQYISDQQRYHRGVQAYRNADCATAIEQFDRVIHSTRLLNVSNFVPQAQQKQAECKYFQRAVDQQQAGKFEAALSNYTILAKVYADSALIDPTRQRVRELLQSTKIDALATSKICTQLDPLAQQNLVPQSDALPQFYLACGKRYEADQNYRQAIALYQKFLNQNPSTQTEAMQRALARATVADIRSQGAAPISPPQSTVITADGSTVVNIQNSAPRKMQITFSGTTPKFAELEPCQDCAIYNVEGPETCPEQGSIGEYKLEPGQYEIAVQFVERSDEDIDAWVGRWKLDEGTEYRSCHVMVRNLDREKEKEKERQNSKQQASL